MLLESLFIKVGGLGPSFLLKETPTQMFSCKICEICKNRFEGHLRMTASVQCNIQLSRDNFGE